MKMVGLIFVNREKITKFAKINSYSSIAPSPFSLPSSSGGGTGVEDTKPLVPKRGVRNGPVMCTRFPDFRILS